MHQQIVSFLGRDKSDYSNGTWQHRPTCEDSTAIRPDPASTILEYAASSRVTIINEAHDLPQHREFTASLLPDLAKLGYTHFAAEDFGFGDALPFDDRNSISRSNLLDLNGYYVHEPSFSRLVDTAMEEGLKLVSYDASPELEDGTSRSERIRARVSIQVGNLWERTLSDPTTRLVVHAGYSHAREIEDGSCLVDWIFSEVS